MSWDVQVREMLVIRELIQFKSSQLVQFVKCWQIFLELNSKRLYQSSGKEKESRLVFTSSTKREIRHTGTSFDDGKARGKD